MDLVANHTAWDSVMMTNKDFYKQDAAGQRHLAACPAGRMWPGLNYANPQLRDIHDRDDEVLDSNLRHGRLPLRRGVGVPTDFWEQARAELEKTKPDIMMLAEASKPELLDKRV